MQAHGVIQDWGQLLDKMLVALMLAFSSAAGILIGMIVMAATGKVAGLPEIVSAALGAGIAVLGAATYTTWRDHREGKNLEAMLRRGIQQVLAAANTAIAHCDARAQGDRELRGLLRDILHKWAPIDVYAPFRELASFEKMGAVQDVQGLCAKAEALYAVDAPRRDATLQVYGLARWNEGERSQTSVRGCAGELATACEAALRLLAK